eukprot:922258-Amphidinium_carterae.1
MIIDGSEDLHPRTPYDYTRSWYEMSDNHISTPDSANTSGPLLPILAPIQDGGNSLDGYMHTYCRSERDEVHTSVVEHHDALVSFSAKLSPNVEATILSPDLRDLNSKRN